MRITIDIPDQIYRELKVRATAEGTTIQEVVLESLGQRLRESEPQETPPRLQLPLIRSKHPGSLKLGEECVYEFIPFP
jgi:hypothetical protein